MRRIWTLALPGALALALAGCAADGAAPPEPQGPTPFGSAAVGGSLVRQKCAGCHAVERIGDSPMKAAPPFRQLGVEYPVRDLQEALAEGLVTTHPAMPPFALEADEVANIIAYLEAVSGTGGPSAQ